ncbi:MAG: toll/interleukin-1 receptor domain-containing protein [Aureispira sp.]
MKKTINEELLYFEAVSLLSMHSVLDGIAYLENPTLDTLRQFSDRDSRTVKKVLKNCIHLGIVEQEQEETENRSYFNLLIPYPYNGTTAKKNDALKEAILKMPLVTSLREFQKLGDSITDSLRKSSAVNGIANYKEEYFLPLLKWAKELRVLEVKQPEDLVKQRVKDKTERQNNSGDVVVFLSHSSKDKKFIRRLAADLESHGIGVWLDEQQIHVGDSINDKISQGLADSDYLLLALSEHSVSSEWVKKELNSMMIQEIQAKKVKILPIKIEDCTTPFLLADKKYADFVVSYSDGLEEVLRAIQR